MHHCAWCCAEIMHLKPSWRNLNGYRNRAQLIVTYIIDWVLKIKKSYKEAEA